MSSNHIQREEIFTYNVTWLRKKHKLSKAKMANLLGIGVKSLTKLEMGKIPPRISVDILFRIEEHFGIHPKYQLERKLDE